MVAYAALISLLQILDSLLHPAAEGRRFFYNRSQLESLHEKVSFLLDFLKDSSSNYGESKDPELERLETKIRDAAYKAEDVIESNISNQLLSETEPRFLFLCMFKLVLILTLLYVAFQKVITLGIQIIILVMYAIPTSVRTLLFFLLIKFLAHKFWELYEFLVVTSLRFHILMSLSAMRIAVVRTARYLSNGYQPENQDLRQTIGDITAMEEEIKIKYAFIRVRDEGTNANLISSKKRLLNRASSKKKYKSKDVYGSGQSADDSDEDSSRRQGKGKSADDSGDELFAIYARLLEHSSELTTVSILGMGGIGKTTLARRVYDSPLIASHFDRRGWVTVSLEYSFCGVLLGLLDSAKIHREEILLNHHDHELDQTLGEHLHKDLMSRRYLIVMDDVWDTKIWDFVRMYFPNNRNGSRVLVTTRQTEVASYANSVPPNFEVKFLNNDDSWYLLREKVFRGEGCAPELEAIGRAIARNCRGLPLAIVVVGGLLYNVHKTVQDWSCVSRNLNSILSEDVEQCWEILGLSYKQLPHRLKPCFLYMGAFLEDEEIRVTRLFNLWAAEGFLEASESKSLEDVAEDYLEELVQRNLIMVGKCSSNGKIKTCKIHNVLRAVCLLNAGEENFVDFGIRDEAENGRRRLRTRFHAFANAGDDSISCYAMARSFICVDQSSGDLSHIYSRFRLLRVLDVAAAQMFAFPDAILQLVLLRYLGLNIINLELPPSISRLWNLQTIVIRYAVSSGLRIPVKIWSMSNLRHLYFWRCVLPDPPHFQLLWDSTVLENLQTLVGALNFQCTRGILESIPNLKKLGICYDDFSPIDWSDCQLESLVNLQQLETLKIAVDYSSLKSVPTLAFPQNLKKLTLSGCRLPWASMRTIGALPNLEVLKLRNEACSGPSWETVEGEFPQLVYLLLEQMHFSRWETDDASHFPCLQRLVIRSCGMLEEIPSAVGDIPTLEMIELVKCHPSVVASAKRIQEEQESMGNDDLKVYCIP